MEQTIGVKPALRSGGVNRFTGFSGLSPALRIRLALGAFLTLIVGTGLLAAGQAFLNDPDTLWHVSVGGDLWDEKAFPHLDPYSHSFAGEPWIAKEWLSQAILFAAYALGGWNGVVLLTTGVLLIVLMQVYWPLSGAVKPVYAAGVAVAAFALCGDTFLARPHIIALPVLIWFVYGVWSAGRRGRAPSFWLLAVLCLWSNMHGSFTFGFIAAGLTFLAYLFEHRRFADAQTYRWIIFLALCPFVSMIHPYGFEAIWSTIIIMNNEAVPYIAEWRAFSAQEDRLVEFALLGGAAAAAATRIRLQLFTVLFLCLLAHMYLNHVRFSYILFTLAPLLIAPEAARQFALMSYRTWAAQIDQSGLERAIAKHAATATAAFGLLLFIVMICGFSLAPWAPRQTYPLAAINAARDYGVTGNAMNGYSFGGALIFEKIPTFVDGRSDRLYQNGFMDKIETARSAGGAEALQALIREYDIGWTIYRPGDARVKMLDDLPGWRRLYEDEYAVVHVMANASG